MQPPTHRGRASPSLRSGTPTSGVRTSILVPPASRGLWSRLRPTGTRPDEFDSARRNRARAPKTDEGNSVRATVARNHSAAYTRGGAPMDTASIETTGQQAIDSMVTLVSSWGLQVIGAIALLIVGRWAAGLVRRLVRRSMERANIEESLIPFFSSATYYIVLMVVGIAVLELFGIQTTLLHRGPRCRRPRRRARAARHALEFRGRRDAAGLSALQDRQLRRSGGLRGFGGRDRHLHHQAEHARQRRGHHPQLRRLRGGDQELQRQ